MNEQQLADLFSEQIDRMLQGHPPVAPADAAHLQPLLALSQQFSQVNFQPGVTAQAAFQSQLSAWFGPLNGGTATAAWGLSKTLLLTLTAAVITIGATLGVVLLASLPEGWFDPQQQIVPNAPEAPQESLEIPAPDNREVTAVPSMPAAVPTSNATVSNGDAVSPPSSSKSDTLAPAASSLEDTLPSKPVLEESVPLPTVEPTPTATPEIAHEVGDDVNGEPGSDGGSNGATGGGPTPTGDHDRGHGNDPDGYDEDNPGQSNGLSDESQGQTGQKEQPQKPGNAPGNFVGGGGSGGSGQGSGGGGQGSGGSGQGSGGRGGR